MTKTYNPPDPSIFAAPQTALNTPRRANVMHGAAKPRMNANLAPQKPSLPSEVMNGYSQIPVLLIDPSPLPPRTVYSEELIQDRAQSLKASGQLMPIIVRLNPDAPGRYIIVDGWSRVLATVEYGISETLEAEIESFTSDAEAAWHGYECNEQREGHSDLDRAYFFKSLLDNGFAENIAQLSGRSRIERSKLVRILTFTKLPQSVISIIKTEPRKFGYFSAVIIFDIFEKAGEVAAVKFVENILEHDMTLRQQATARDHVLAGNVVKANSRKAVKETKFSGTVGVGAMKIFNDGIDVKIRSLPSDKVVELHELIEKFMSLQEDGTVT
jgi:ParB family chromosome partitioning protein